MVSCGDDNIVTKGNPIENPDPEPDPEAGLRVVNKVKYRPYNYMMWDNWYIVKEDSIHLFHLQGIVNGVSYSRVLICADLGMLLPVICCIGMKSRKYSLYMTRVWIMRLIFAIPDAR